MKYLVSYAQYSKIEGRQLSFMAPTVEYGNAVTEDPIDWLVNKRIDDPSVILLNIMPLTDGESDAIVETFR